MSTIPEPASRRTAHPTPAPDWSAGGAEPLIGGNQVDLLGGGASADEALLAALDSARDHVNVECLLGGEEPSAGLLAALTARAREGVRVNLLVDAGAHADAALLAALRRPGVSVAEHDPGAWSGLFPGPSRRCERRELVIVDGREAFVGGIDVHGGRDTPAGSRRGLCLWLRGPVLPRLQRLFIGQWQRFALGPMQQARYFPSQAVVGDHRVGVAAGKAGDPRNPFIDTLLAVIDRARQRIALATPCETPPRRLLQALAQACARGVAVDLLVPRGGSGLMRGLPMRQVLHAAGVRVHEAQPGLWHARMCLVDGEWVGIGSTRLDWRNAARDAEAGLAVVDGALAERLERVFREDVQRSHGVGERRAQAGWQRPPRGAVDVRS